MNDSEDEFTRFEHEGWERVAERYDSVWSSLTRQFIPPLLSAARVSPGQKLLDDACGPGYVAAAAKQLGATPFGVDFSSQMVRAATRLYPSIEFQEGDAQQLTFADNSFDRVVMNFGLLHLSKPERACAEACRVLRPGGRFACTVWAGPEENPGARIMNHALETHADMTVPIPSGPPYYLFTSRDECRSGLQEVGFDKESLTFDTISVEWQVPSATFLFEAERDAGVRTAALLAQQTAERLASIRSAIEQSVKPYARGERFSIPMSAHVIAVSKRS